MSRIIVVGAVNVDLVVAVDELPGRGRTVVGRRLERHGGGKGANAAVAAARAGADVALVAAVGDDEEGNAALAELGCEGVDTSAVARLSHEPTGAALVVVDRTGENQIAVGAGANAALGADHVEATLGERLPGCGCVLVSTEVAEAAIAAAVRAAVAAEVPCVLNPAPVTPAARQLLGCGVVLTPNRAELAELLEDDAAPDAAADAAALARRAGRPSWRRSARAVRSSRHPVASRDA